MIDGFLGSVMPFVIIIGVVLIIVAIIKMKNDGTGVIKEIKDKKVIFMEVTLGAMNLVEALVAASTAQAHGLSYGTRLGMHLVLAFASITMGITYFNQFTQLYDSVKSKDGLGVFKNTLDVVLASFMVFLPPFINTMFIALNMGSKDQVQAFFLNLASFRFSDAVFSIKDPTSFVSAMIFIIHIIGIVYLGLYALETKGKSRNEPRPTPRNPKPESKPEPKPESDTLNDDEETINFLNKKLRRPS